MRVVYMQVVLTMQVEHWQGELITWVVNAQVVLIKFLQYFHVKKDS